MSPEEIIDQALRRYERPLISYARDITGDVDSARDAVQETFLRLSRQNVSVLAPRLAPWLFLVCRNCALDHKRKIVRFSQDAVNEDHPSTELLTVKLRYKAPDGERSRLLEFPLVAPQIPDFAHASPDFRFAAAVAAFGKKLRGSPTAENIDWAEIQKIARESLGADPGSHRAEFLTLIEKAARLKPSNLPTGE